VQSFSGPSAADPMTVFYSLRFQTSKPGGARSLYLYPPGIGWPSYTPRHWVPFSSPSTNRRATVEVFETASTRRIASSFQIFALKFCVHFSYFQIPSTFFTHHIPFEFIILIIFIEGYNLRTSLLGGFFTPSYFLPLKSKFSPQHPVLRCPQFK
jgi:hypothetical protein